MFRRKAADNNNESLGGEAPRSERDEVRHLLKKRGIKIENDGPPVAGVTRLPGQGLAGFGGVFDRQIEDQLSDQHQQRRRQRYGGAEMNEFLRDGGVFKDDK